MTKPPFLSFYFFFNDTATTEIYTLSLTTLFRSVVMQVQLHLAEPGAHEAGERRQVVRRDRKSTRLNSSHDQISYAVFCLKKKNNRNRGNVKVTGAMERSEVGR